jgi:glycosyltransferase involved in cell wall biosynthesis
VRILHAARNIADQPGAAVRALRRLGHDAEVWEYGDNPFGFKVDRTIPLDAETKDPTVFWRTFSDAIERFDVLHFHFARTLFPADWGGLPPFWDLPIYRILGKRVFFTFHGTDVRIRRIHEQVNPWSYYRTSDIAADDDRTEKVIEICRTYADGMFVTSIDLRHFVPEAVVLPRIIDLADWPEQPAAQRDVPVVLHVPSQRGTKGTDRILAGLERLRDNGVAFELRLLEGVPHAEARRAIADADVVVDNLITGDYEVVSVETMASARVAVANVGPTAAEAFPDAPVWSVDPDTFEARMRDLLTDRERRLELAGRGRPYVARVHDAPVIAARLVEAYEAPPDTTSVDARSFPDWISLAPARRIERLERQVSRAEAELARTRVREEELRARLGLRSLGPVTGHVAPTVADRLRTVLPEPVKRPLRRLRARYVGRRPR